LNARDLTGRFNLTGYKQPLLTTICNNGPQRWLGIDEADYKLQGDNYYSLCKLLPADGGPVPKTTKTAQIIRVSFAIAEACFWFVAIANVFVGITAQRVLEEFYSRQEKTSATSAKISISSSRTRSSTSSDVTFSICWRCTHKSWN
jgi:hypothetical protein